MPIIYGRKVEKQANGTYLIGLRGEDENGKVTHIWKPYATKPDLATFKTDFKARQKDGQGQDIVGSSLKEQLDKWFADRDAEGKPADETPADPSVTFP